MKNFKLDNTMIFLLLSLIILPCTVFADVRPAKIFSSNMVLQQGTIVPFWGWADSGEQVRVIFNHQTRQTIADKSGRWQVKFPKMAYGGPFKVEISGNNSLTLENVMVGEVWICSGQSNMEFQVSRSINGEQEIENSNYSNIRLFKVPRRIAQHPESDLENGEWLVCSPETSPDFSAVGYFFGRALHTDLNVPIGLIQSAWGGTVAESWTSSKTIEDDPDFGIRYRDLLALDMENYEKQMTQKIEDKIGRKIPLKDKGLIDGKAFWAAADYDDSRWAEIIVPSFWEDQGYELFNGIGWYRREVILTRKQASRATEIHLGKIDATDISWVNGIKIGTQKGKANMPRVYPVKGFFKKGRNVIAVRVRDNASYGGMYGEREEDLFLLAGKDTINISGTWKFRVGEVFTRSLKIGPNNYPTLLFNGMINPLIPYAIKGVIWYQGESNAARAKQYRRVFSNLITDWRFNWNDDDFPFLFVSLANFHQAPAEPGDSPWAELREAQTMALQLRTTGMALAIDIGMANNIHPKNKQDVGARLELAALNKGYNKKIVYTGPMYKSMKIRGDEIIIQFKESGSSLTSIDDSRLIKGFSIAGKDRKFHWAQAKILNRNSVSISCKGVVEPLAVRYGWADNPGFLNLYNKEGLPANPFRTDDWPGITK